MYRTFFIRTSRGPKKKGKWGGLRGHRKPLERYTFIIIMSTK